LLRGGLANCWRSSREVPRLGWPQVCSRPAISISSAGLLGTIDFFEDYFLYIVGISGLFVGFVFLGLCWRCVRLGCRCLRRCVSGGPPLARRATSPHWGRSDGRAEFPSRAVRARNWNWPPIPSTSGADLYVVIGLGRRERNTPPGIYFARKRWVTYITSRDPPGSFNVRGFPSDQFAYAVAYWFSWEASAPALYFEPRLVPN